jgi:hypothetical protein
MGILSKLEIVQNYQVKGTTIKNYLEEKHKGFDNGWTVEDDVVIFYFSPTIKIQDNPLRSPAEYIWRIEGEKIISISGKANELTPELDERKQEIETRKQSISTDELTIYNFIMNEDVSSDSEFLTAFEKASVVFGLTPSKIEEIYLKIDRILYS